MNLRLIFFFFFFFFFFLFSLIFQKRLGLRFFNIRWFLHKCITFNVTDEKLADNLKYCKIMQSHSMTKNLCRRRGGPLKLHMVFWVGWPKNYVGQRGGRGQKSPKFHPHGLWMTPNA